MDSEKLNKANALDKEISDKQEHIRLLQAALAYKNAGVVAPYHYGNYGASYVGLFTDEKARMFINLAIAEAQAELETLRKEFAAL